jgi:hypothetical protein
MCALSPQNKSNQLVIPNFFFMSLSFLSKFNGFPNVQLSGTQSPLSVFLKNDLKSILPLIMLSAVSLSNHSILFPSSHNPNFSSYSDT